MDIREQIGRQRVKYILTSYNLDQGALEDEKAEFTLCLEELLVTYPLPLIELAIAETLVDQWLVVPMARGIPFLKLVHDILKAWEEEPIISTLTPAQFQQITGLSSTAIFGTGEMPPSQPVLRPS